MKINFIAFTIASVLAGLSSAQNGLPTCAQSCVTKYTSGSQIAGCANLDIACICSNESFLSGIACCLADACEPADEQMAVAYAQNLCKTSGVTNLPSVVSCASTASSTASSAVSTSTGTPTSGSTNTSTATGINSSSTGSPSTATTESQPSATNNSNSGVRHEIGVGAGLLGGLGAMIALL